MSSLQLQLSSTNADSKNDNEYIYYIPSASIPADVQEHIYISVQSAVIPYSFYNINRFNNTLYYSLSSNNVEQYFSLPLGNYNIKDLVSYFNENFTGFTTTFDKQTNKLAFQNNSYLNFTFYPKSTIYNVLGFTNGLIYNSEGGYLSSRNSVNFNSIQYVNIKSNLNTNSLSKYNLNDRRTLCSIPVNLNPGGVLNYQNSNNFRINTFTNSITELSISFTDQNGNNIDFNGCQWSLVFQFDIVNYVE